MKKLSIIFITTLCLGLVSCKTRLDNLAANSNDDVYYNPAKDRKLVANPQYNNNNNQNYNQQNTNQQPQQYYSSNTGKIAATHADSLNPNYQDPKFNYDDYYDNAYAARVSRFQNPIYGTGYYDSYYTNQYSYTGNPNTYGNSIYNSYPSSSYNSYNNYGMGNYGMSGYNMYGSNMGYGNGIGYGNGLSVGVGYGSGMGGFYSPSAAFGSYYNNPYYSMGYGSSMYGMGYNPYGMNSMYGMGYSPYGMSSMYGMGYGMGYSGYNPYMTGYNSGSYYNPYDYNSASSSVYNGPRTSHTGGNSVATSTPRAPLHDEVPGKNPNATFNNSAVSPASMERFSQVSIPRENMVKIAEAHAPVRANTQYQPINNGGTYGSEPRQIQGNNNSNYSTGRPATAPSLNNQTTTTQPARPSRWYNSPSVESNNYNNSSRPAENSGFSQPSRSNFDGGGSSWGGSGGGGSFGGGRSGGGGGGSFGGGGGHGRR